MKTSNQGPSNAAKYRTLAAGLRTLEAKAGVTKPEILRMFDACQQRQAYMVTIGKAFFVLKPHDGYVFLWMAAGPHGSFKRCIPLVDEMARAVDAKYIEWRSPRRGWLGFVKQGECVRYGNAANGDTIYRRFL